YGKNAVGVDEFLRAYNKNITPVTDKEKSLKEYLDLYIDFKLKVQAAQELRLDTSDQIKLDIENFRSQVAENYLNDEKSRDILVTEAVNRSLVEKHILHFAIPRSANETAADSAAALAQMHTIKSSWQGAGNETNVPGVKDAGFVSVFALPYAIENIIYALQPGQVSAPYKTKNAWHLFKVTEQRPASGKWKVAQILLTLPPGAGEAEKAFTRNRADSIYGLLQKGEDFSFLANKFSEDKLTYLNGGEMPEFSNGTYDPAFEKAAFELPKDGAFSKPFQTNFGYHILKRVAHTPAVVNKDDAALQYEIKQAVLNNDRIDLSRQKFTRDVKVKIGFAQTTAVSQNDLLRYADSVMKTPMADNARKYPISNKKIITFNKGAVTGADWLKFVVEYKTNYTSYKGETNKELWDKFVVYSVNENYKKDMETYNADFKYQMKEFKEGNMLFEVMERNVWGNAAKDSNSLQQHYQQNRNKYVWAASADIIIFNNASEQLAASTLAAVKNGVSLNDIVAAGNNQVQIDSGRYELAQITGKENDIVPQAGSFTPIVLTMDSAATFVKYLRIYPAGQLRSYEESKGLVINDYQVVLEQRWLAILKKKYPVKINEAVFKSLLKKQ
ncbi:MAG: peptidylprolyl isomerase, partial [Ferruginibacter sp.]